MCKEHETNMRRKSQLREQYTEGDILLQLQQQQKTSMAELNAV